MRGQFPPSNTSEQKPQFFDGSYGLVARLPFCVGYFKSLLKDLAGSADSAGELMTLSLLRCNVFFSVMARCEIGQLASV